MSEFSEYRSPFTWRYASVEMRRIWSEVNKRLIWRQIWIALADTQAEYGLVSTAQVEDLRNNASEIDMKRALEIEAEIHHDLMAELKTFAGQCTLGGGILHAGATSTDIEDNADVLRMRAALRVLLSGLGELLNVLAGRIEQTAEIPVIGFTHLQPAEPTTLGYRLASYAQDLLADYRALAAVAADLHGKGFKGAVGTAAAYGDLIGADQLEEFEKKLSSRLDLPFFPVTSQTYPRKQDYRIISALAGLGASLYKFAFDLRMLQSPAVGEWNEPFGASQVGSSAMPFKRNPINAEKIDSLARALAVMPQVAWQNAANSLLERTLDDSANRRSLLPEAFLLTDELLITALKILRGLRIDGRAIERNLLTYAPFACTERILMALVTAGADRQEMHERLRGLALQAWEAVQGGQQNPLISLIKEDREIIQRLTPEKIEQIAEVRSYLGFAESRAREMAARVRLALKVPGSV